MLTFFVVVLAAFAPAVFWLWIIYRWDKYKPEPKWLVIRTFFFGLLVAIPVAIIEVILYPRSLQGDMSLATAAYAAFIVAGVTEEAGKFLVVRKSVYNSPHFEEPMDGLIYASAAALGFAAIENVVYVLSFGIQVLLVRGLFSNLAHVLFSALWGYPLELTKLGILKHKSLTWVGLAAAMIAHGAFDFLLFTQSSFTWLVIPFFILMVILFVVMYVHANRISVYIKHRT